MNTDNTQGGAEPSPASAGSQPAGWGAVASDGSVVCMMRRRADVASYVVDGTPIVPLYRSPTLTDEEREAIEWAIDKTARTYDDPEGGPMKRESMRRLLDRTK